MRARGHNRRLRIAGVAGAIALMAGMFVSPVSAAPITIDLTGSSDQGSLGNTRTYTSNGVTVTATAWSYNGTFKQAALGRWTPGLGICDSSELSSGNGCISPEHEVDNSGNQNYVLFQFSTPVDPMSVNITTTSGDDLDVSYWVSTLTLPGNLLQNDTFSDLATRGFGSRIDNGYHGSADSRTVTLTSGFVTGLLFGARSGQSNDAFKLAQLTISKPRTSTVPEPTSTLLFGLALTALAPRLRRLRS